MPRAMSALVLCAVAALVASPVHAAPVAGSGCGGPKAAKEHCGAPESNLGCCWANSKCYSTDDCASFLDTCPHSNDTKKAVPLAECMSKAAFKPSKCSAAAKAGKDVPVDGFKLTCFANDKMLCDVYKNKTATFINAQCKRKPPPPPDSTKNAAALSAPSSALVLALCAAVAALAVWL